MEAGEMPSIYEMPLQERLEKANRDFSEACLLRLQLQRLGVSTYRDYDLRWDLYAVAGNYGLLAETLRDYFLMVHKTDVPPS
jgi:hypothetical protein